MNNPFKKTHNKLLFPALFVIVAIIAAVLINLSAVQSMVDSIYDFCISKFGWLFVTANLSCLVFSLWIMFGPYRNVRLGGEQCKPDFSTLSWAGMMFTTSCGGWLVVYGFIEPIYCSAAAPFQIEPLSTQAYEMGQAYAHFHWGPNAWCIYVPISVAISYALYNRHAKRGTIGQSIESATGYKGGNCVRYIADLIAVCASIIAPVISIGTGMPLLVALVESIFGISDEYRTYIQAVILAIWVIMFGISIFLGLKKGIQRLSNINVTVAFVFMGIVGLLAGLFYILSAEVNTVGTLMNNYLRMSTYTDPYGTGSFVKGWTIGYWACYFVYMPLMGVFNAKISKGRRLKELAFGQLILCTLGCWVAMGTFGNYAMRIQVENKADIAGFLAEGDEAGAIIAIMQTMPISKAMMTILLVIAFVFLATTMDSSAFSAAEMTSKQENGEVLAPRWLRLMWASAAAVFAFVLVQVGGAKAVRSLCYIAGLPLALIVFMIIYSAVKMLRKDHAEECEDKKRIRIFGREK